MNEKFKADLAKGMEFEEKVLEEINGEMSAIKNPNERGIDILAVDNKELNECKNISEFLKDKVAEILNTKEYEEWKKNCLDRDGYTCQITGKKDGGENILVVHNIIPISSLYEGGEELFNIDNGITIHNKIKAWFVVLFGENASAEDWEYFKSAIVGIEVKADHYNFHKGKTTNQNAYIEYSAYGKASGIFRKEEIEMTYWAHSISPHSFFLLDGIIFKQFVYDRIVDCGKNISKKSKGFRITTGGDGRATKGLLIPVGELEKMAIKIYNLKKETDDESGG